MIAEPAARPRGRAERAMSSLLGLVFLRGRVTEVRQVTERMLLIGIASPALRDLKWLPGQQVRVFVGTSPVSGDALRTYSIWDHHDETVELCALDHGEGPGSRWARTVAVGDDVRFSRPKGRFVIEPSGRWHFFAGEETASVAFGAMIRALPATAHIRGLIEVAGEGDRLELPRTEELTWRYRGESSAASSAGLVAAVRALTLPAEPGVAYLAGEARTCQAVRDQLVRERGWPRRSVLVKPFWTPGKRGME